MTSCRVYTTGKGEKWVLRAGGGAVFDFICRTWQRKFWKIPSVWTEENVCFESEDAAGVNRVRIEPYNL
jgi:hypothetical protein